MLVSGSLASLDERRELLKKDTQAIDLNGNQSGGYVPGTPGKIEQDFITNSALWHNVSFRIGNNPNTWCTNANNGYTGKRYAGEQRVRVDVIDPNTQQSIVAKEINIGVAKQKKALNGWMDPQWHTSSLAFKPGNAGQSYTIRFESLSEEGKACGALITGLDVSANSTK